MRIRKGTHNYVISKLRNVDTRYKNLQKREEEFKKYKQKQLRTIWSIKTVIRNILREYDLEDVEEIEEALKKHKDFFGKSSQLRNIFQGIRQRNQLKFWKVDE